jgi:hypothetical protein
MIIDDAAPPPPELPLNTIQAIATQQCHVPHAEVTKEALNSRREHFDQSYPRNFYHMRINNYAYTPSVGNSGGLITIWNGNLFTSTVTSQCHFQITIDFKCNLSGTIWTLMNVYGPAHNEHRGDFMNWLNNIDTSTLK